MKLIEKHVRLVIAVLVLIIVMLSIALWSSSYINRLDTYYFNEYLDSADTLEWVSYNLPKKFALHAKTCIIRIVKGKARSQGGDKKCLNYGLVIATILAVKL